MKISSWFCCAAGAALCLVLPETAWSKAADADALILTAEGTQAATAELRVLDRQAGSAGAPDRIAAGFRPPRLAPGEYHLLVTLTGPTGKIQTSAAEFTVPAGGGG